MALKYLREAAGLTRAELAERTGINPRMLEGYEQGRKDINGAKLKTLLKLCVALKCRLEDILTDEETLDLLTISNRYKSGREIIGEKIRESYIPDENDPDDAEYLRLLQEIREKYRKENE